MRPFVQRSSSCDLLYVNGLLKYVTWLFLFLYDRNLQLVDINAVKCWYKKKSFIISMAFIENYVRLDIQRKYIEGKPFVL